MRPNSSAQQAAKNSIIRIEMQPKRQIRMREEPSQKSAASAKQQTKVIMSRAAEQESSEISRAKITFRKGSTAFKALE